MSMDYCFKNADVVIKFANADECKKHIKAFNSEVEKEDELYEGGEYDYPLKAYARVSDKDTLVAEIIIDSDSDECVDIDRLADLICEHFPTANGTIGWSVASESAGGFCRSADGGTITIENGKIKPSASEQLNELKNDLFDALDYISNVVSNGDITECGVAHLFKKYMPEDYEMALREKEE